MFHLTKSAEQVTVLKASNSIIDNMSSLDHDFVAQFNEKLKDIRDICSGKTESVMDMDDTTLEEKEAIDENQVWNMFEDIKRQVIKLDITGGSLMDIGNSLKDINDTKNVRRWFEGSFYICKKCNKKEYGDTMFRCHLKKKHQLILMRKNTSQTERTSVNTTVKIF